MVKRIRSRFKNCSHAHGVTISAAGIERTVCESCGRVSFKLLAEVSDSEGRARFRRELETNSVAS